MKNDLGFTINYKLGESPKCRFDCLWYYFTRKFEVISHNDLINIKPKEFDNW